VPLDSEVDSPIEVVEQSDPLEIGSVSESPDGLVGMERARMRTMEAAPPHDEYRPLVPVGM